MTVQAQRQVENPSQHQTDEELLDHFLLQLRMPWVDQWHVSKHEGDF